MIRKNFAKLWDYLQSHPREVNYFYLATAAFLLLVQFSTFSGMLFRYSTSQTILSSFDDDSAYGVETAINTNLINHNHNTSYGPIYYRLSVPLRYLLVHDYETAGMSADEKIQKSVFFHLLLINLLGIFLACFLLMRGLAKDLHWQIFGTSILASAFLQNELRSFLLFVAKPDHLMVCFATWAGFVTVQWLSDTQNLKQLKKLSFSWALVSATKLASLFLIPSFLFLFLSSGLNKFRSLKTFLKWLIIFYFVLGFPQTLDLWAYLKYLMQQNAYTKLVSWDFLVHNWLPLFWQDVYRPALVILVLSFIVPMPKNLFSKKVLTKFFIFVAIGWAVVMSKQTISPFRWYSFPFVNLFLVFWVLFLVKVQSGIKLPQRYSWNKHKNHFLYPAMIFFLTPLLVSFFPKELEKRYNSGLTCRPQAEKIKAMVEEKVSKGFLLYADTYIPFDRKLNKKEIYSEPDASLALLKSRNFDYLFFAEFYYRTLLNTPGETADFYGFFHNKAVVTDPYQRQWVKIYTDSCSFEVWERR